MALLHERYPRLRTTAQERRGSLDVTKPLLLEPRAYCALLAFLKACFRAPSAEIQVSSSVPKTMFYVLSSSLFLLSKMTGDIGHRLPHAVTNALACARWTLTGLRLQLRLSASFCSTLQHPQVGCIHLWRPHCDWRPPGLPAAKHASAEAGPAEAGPAEAGPAEAGARKLPNWPALGAAQVCQNMWARAASCLQGFQELPATDRYSCDLASICP